MEVYLADENSKRAFRDIIFQHGSGNIDRYIFSGTQEGEGIGSFLGKLFTRLLPLAKKSIKGAYSFVKPELKNISHKIIDAGADLATKKIHNISLSAKKKVEGKKRKLGIDSLDLNKDE